MQSKNKNRIHTNVFSRKMTGLDWNSGEGAKMIVAWLQTKYNMINYKSNMHVYVRRTLAVRGSRIWLLPTAHYECWMPKDVTPVVALLVCFQESWVDNGLTRSDGVIVCFKTPLVVVSMKDMRCINPTIIIMCSWWKIKYTTASILIKAP